jgi:hypothetical protein
MIPVRFGARADAPPDNDGVAGVLGLTLEEVARRLELAKRAA